METKSLHALSGHIRLNQPLPWDVVDSAGRPLLRKGIVVTDPKQLAVLLERGAYVDRIEYECYVKDNPPPPPAAMQADPFWRWDSVHKRLNNALREHVTDPAFVQDIGQIAADIDRLTGDERDASIFAIVQLEMERYPISHSLRTAFVSGLIARGMEMGEDERLTLLKAALTMNLAMIELQRVLHRQTAPLTDAQRAELKTHPTRGAQKLQTLGVTDAAWLRAVAEHHEKADGKGYPAGLNEVSPLAEAIHYADTYCALTSASGNRKAAPPKSVARELFVAGNATGSTIPAVLVKELGIYPPGSFVKLANGEIGVVVRRGASANTPFVCGLQDRKGAIYTKPTNRDTRVAEFAVVDAAMPESARFALNPMRLYGYDV